MNKVYKIVWNSRLFIWQVTSELAKSHGSNRTSTATGEVAKTGNSKNKIRTLLFSFAMLPISVWAAIQDTTLPTGANITSGSAQIVQQQNSLNITQGSQNLSTNWETFNIGENASVNFYQPNQSAIAVNRVLDNNASQIMGRLNANGQIFLLNPNGVIFSKTAQVNVGGIVASTLEMSEADISQGKFTFSNSGTAGHVENHGSIIANGGVVALIAPTVINTGTIQAPDGVVHLTAADQVTLQLQDGSLTEYQIDLGTLQGLIDNGGAIQADNGAVYLTAKAKNSLSQVIVNHSGIIEANRLSQNAKGEIILLGDMAQGSTTVSGILNAEGKNGQDGGFIETSAAIVKITDNAKISTQSDTGQTGNWLIDPNDFTIAATSGDVSGTTLGTQLTTTDITIKSDDGASGTSGNIYVNDSVTWNTGTALTLDAQNDIYINQDISATNGGKLNLKYGQATTDGGSSDYYLNNGAKVNLTAGQNFSTQKGNEGALIDYTVITELGTESSTTGTDLQGIRGDLFGNYVLGEDIDATATSTWDAGKGFIPLGNLNYDPLEFRGKFDGLGHTVTNLSINRPTINDVGLFGRTNNATLRNIGLIGANIIGNSYVGGLAGENYSLSVTNAYATGSVSGTMYVGGLFGRNDSSAVDHVYTTTSVTSGGYSGGVTGYNVGGSVSDAYATGTVVAGESAGGLVGRNELGIFNNVYANGSVSGSYNIGGLIGYNISGTVSNAYATGIISGGTYGNSIGGLLGSNVYGTLNNTYATGAVSGSSYIGGLVGQNYGTVSNAYATGTVTGYYGATGGLIGLNYYSSVSNAYATGAVNGVYYVGGLVGELYGGTLSNTYAMGAVSGQQTGGLVGLNVYGGQVNTSYWNTETSGQSTSQGGTGLSSEQFKQGSSFAFINADSKLGGTDTVWRIYEGNTAPLLRSFLTELELNTLNQTTTYNGQTQTLDLTGLDVNELFIASGSSGGTNAGTYTVNYYSDQQGYDLIGDSVTLTINKAQATVTANSKTTTYNGLEQSVTGFTATGLVNGEDTSVLSAVSTTGGKGTNAGQYTHTASGSDENYELSFVDGALDIAKAQAAVTANSKTTTYNGLEQSVTGFTATGLVNGEDTSVLSAVSTTGGKGINAGQYTHTASGSDENYELSFVDGALDIAKAQATVTANSKTTTYNGLEQSVTGFTATGLVNGEDTSVLNSVTTSGGVGSNAGQYVHTASGSDENYELSFVDGALQIDRAKINQVSGITANSHDYDGTTEAELNTDNASFDGIIADDVLEVATAVGEFTDPNVGIGKTVNISGIILGGDDAGNYELINNTAITTADIYPLVQPYDALQDNPYRRAIQFSQPEEKARQHAVVEIEIIGAGINVDNIQTLTGER